LFIELRQRETVDFAVVAKHFEKQNRRGQSSPALFKKRLLLQVSHASARRMNCLR
jgi:hypothetical protein